ncbi:MAG: dihydrofolate reductase family protein [Nannocystaceae bacterium]
MTATPPRPRVSVFLAQSLDGYIARPDGGLDWLEAVQRPGEDYGFAEFFAGVDALMIGRNTYDVVLGFDPWPYADKRCVVLTRRPPPPRHGEVFRAGEPAALLDALARDGVRHVYVDGGAVIQRFLAADLVDALTLSILPVILGDGIALFARTPAPERPLELVDARSWPAGLAQLRYRRR